MNASAWLVVSIQLHTMMAHGELHQSEIGKNIIWSWMYEVKVGLADRRRRVLVAHQRKDSERKIGTAT